MKATEANFLQFLLGNNKQFTIPIYQRTYSWAIAQCKQLWEDIIRVAQKAEVPGHFIGSIVYIAKGIYTVSAIQQLLVIDGQQRLATISLLLSALARAVDRPDNKLEITGKKIRHYYLVNAEEEGDLHYKLLLTQNDRETLMSLLDGHPMPAKPSRRIVENYQFFEKAIRDCGVDLGTIFKGIEKLIIVDVSLDRTQDNPQLIFESLNSTGLELSQADLIRNFILMGLENHEQTELYQNYWYPMETSFGAVENSNYFNRFMRDYLTIKNRGQIPRIDDVYGEFKTYVHEHPDMTTKQVVEDLCYYSKYFVKMAFERETDKEINSLLKEINTLKVDVAYPFLLEVFEDYEKKVIQRQDLLAILRMVESYVFRRAICGIPPNSLNKTFALLHQEIDPTSYLESVQAAFLVKESYKRLPQDEEFRQQFMIKDVYNFRSRIYMLRRLENAHRTKELVNVENYTIEHILPQNKNLSNEWKDELGPNWQQIHAQYLHTIGNLTLTGYNPEFSDNPFLQKRDYPETKGFKNSPLVLNQYLATLDHWNETTIQARARQLAEEAVKIWPVPKLPEEVLEKYRSRKKEPDEEETPITSLDYYKFLQGDLLEVYQTLRQRIQNLDSSIREEFKKYYIAFKIVSNCIDVVPLKSMLKLYLNMPVEEIKDPKELCRDVSDVGRQGNGKLEVCLSAEEEMEDVMQLVEQAVTWQLEE